MSFAKKPIKEFALGIYDGPHATPKDSNDGHIFLGIKNVTSDGRLSFSEIKYVSDEEFSRWTKRVTPQQGDVVFSYEATLHRYALIPEGFDGCLGRRMALIRPNPKKLLSRFLHYYFLAPEWRAYVETKVIIGATVNRLPIKDFPSFEVAIPPIDHQQKVVNILSAYDDLIENNRRRIQLLDDSARLLYQEWFVHLRFPGHEHIKIVDGVPEGWSKEPLENLLILQRGFDLPSNSRVYGAIPIYASTGVNGFHNQAKVKGPGVVTGRSGSLGTVMYVSKDHWPLNTALWVKEFKKVSPIFATFLLRAMKLENYNGGAAVPTLNRNDVHKVDVLCPESRFICQFDEQVSPIFSQIEKLQEYNAKLAEARDIMLPRLMNGTIIV